MGKIPITSTRMAKKLTVDIVTKRQLKTHLATKIVPSRILLDVPHVCCPDLTWAPHSSSHLTYFNETIRRAGPKKLWFILH
jgi:hypothetical protein